MTPFYEGIVAGISILGGMCAFNYWMFAMMEKRLDIKLTSLGEDVHSIANELIEERRNKANLYNFVLEKHK